MLNTTCTECETKSYYTYFSVAAEEQIKNKSRTPNKWGYQRARSTVRISKLVFMQINVNLALSPLQNTAWMFHCYCRTTAGQEGGTHALWWFFMGWLVCWATLSPAPKDKPSGSSHVWGSNLSLEVSCKQQREQKTLRDVHLPFYSACCCFFLPLKLAL